MIDVVLMDVAVPGVPKPALTLTVPGKVAARPDDGADPGKKVVDPRLRLSMVLVME